MVNQSSWANYTPSIQSYSMAPQRALQAQSLLNQIGQINTEKPQPVVSQIARYCYNNRISPTLDHPQGIGDIAALAEIKSGLKAKGFESLKQLIDMREESSDNISQIIAANMPKPKIEDLYLNDDAKTSVNKPVGIGIKIGQEEYDLLEFNESKQEYQMPSKSFAQIKQELNIQRPLAFHAIDSLKSDQHTLLQTSNNVDRDFQQHYQVCGKVFPQYRFFKAQDLSTLGQLKSETQYKGSTSAMTSGHFNEIKYDPSLKAASLSVRSFKAQQPGFVEAQISHEVLETLNRRQSHFAFGMRMSEGTFNPTHGFDDANRKALEAGISGNL